MEEPNLLFLHGYESSGNGFKANFLRQIFPTIETPTLTGELDQRLEQINSVFQENKTWIIIGSSYGGLMAAILAAKSKVKIVQLVLLAPALLPSLIPDSLRIKQIDIPTTIISGKQDEIVPTASIKDFSTHLFTQLKFIEVEDDHRLHSTTKHLDWRNIIQL